MNCTKITVGGKFPTNLDFTSIYYEVEYQLQPNETIDEATDKCKLLVAKQVSGGDSKLFKTALKVLNCPGNEYEIRQQTLELEEVEASLKSMKDLIQQRQAKLKGWVEVEDRYVNLKQLLNLPECAASFWDIFEKVLAQDEHPLMRPDENEGRNYHTTDMYMTTDVESSDEDHF